MNCWSTARDLGLEKRRYLSVSRIKSADLLVEYGSERPRLETSYAADEASRAVLFVSANP